MVLLEENAARIRRHFGTKKLSELPLPKAGRIITIPLSMSIRDASKILADLKIQSAPIVNDNTKESKEWWEMYSGVFDMYQLLEFALFEAQQAFASGDSLQHFSRILIEALSDCTISQLRSVDDHCTLRHLPADASILDALELVAKYDAKRIAVVGPQPNSPTFMNFITSSTILERIANDCCCEHSQTNSPHLHPDGAKHCLDGLRVADLHLDVPGLCGIVSALDTTPVLGAFITLYHTNVRGIAIINQHNEIVGNLSCSDIHHLVTHPEFFAEVCINHMPVRDYIALLRPQGTLRLPVTCTPDEPLATVIDQMTKNHVHRIYVVNKNNIPTGVVTVRDIIRALLPHVESRDEKDEKRKRQWDEDSDLAFSLSHSRAHTPNSAEADISPTG